MAKKAKTEKTDDIEGQQEMFPELDKENEEHKKLLSASKALAKARAERAELLGTSKKKVDAAEEKVIGLMHENKLTKFRNNGVIVEIVPSGEKVEVREYKVVESNDGEGDELE